MASQQGTPGNPTPQQQQAATELAGALIGAGGVISVAAVVAILLALLPTLPRAVAEWLATMTSAPILWESPFPPSPQEERQIELARAYRAWYLVWAATRLAAAAEQGPESLDAAKRREVVYFARQMKAQSARLAAAGDVARAAQRWQIAYHGRYMLGWRAMMDPSTTPECRAANGKNFYADREPIIGWPGAVHPKCRCVATAPTPGAPILPSV